jgi:glycoprotein endo-alpha-1,2-mannosidase
MTRRRLTLAAACLLVVAGAALADPARPAATAGPRVGIFYYPWWGTLDRDGSWLHWSQNAHLPPDDLPSSFYPARGPYSSSDPAVVRSQMREIARTGVDTVIVSWWGPGSMEDVRLPLVLREARAARLRVAIHIEPWTDRTPAAVGEAIRTLQGRGIREFFVYDSSASPDEEWAAVLPTLDPVVVYANTTLVGKARGAGFDGVYTYDVYIHSGGSFPRMCAQARTLGLMCAPSVGPGYDASRATGDIRRQPRKRGARYDAMWERALRAQPGMVTITSYNEWHEGTQIEPARAIGAPYLSYEGAYGLTGRAAERAYIDRTTEWVRRSRTPSSPIRQ